MEGGGFSTHISPFVEVNREGGGSPHISPFVEVNREGRRVFSLHQSI